MEENQLFKAGSFEISIGSPSHMVAIFSRRTDNFVKLSTKKRSPKLRKVYRKFKLWLNSKEVFSFERMPENRTLELIEMMKK